MIGQSTKKESLGRIQIIAKTLLIICGLFVADKILLDFVVLLPSVFLTSGRASLNGILFHIIAIGFSLMVILYLMVINNEWLARKILPFEDAASAGDERLWLSSSLRIGLVFCGLIFFAGSTDAIIYSIKAIAALPSAGWQLFSDIIKGNSLFTAPDYHSLSGNIYKLFKTALVIYLSAGAPGFVGWQVKRTFKISKLQGMKNG